MDRASILEDPVAEANRLVTAAVAEDVPIRLLGGGAIQVAAGERLLPNFRRRILDLDLVIPKGQGRRVSDFLVRQGYVPNETFNAMRGDRRLLFFDLEHERQVDVFVGTFEMCHTIPLAGRVLLQPATLPLADLLMTKLQIVKLNPKDVIDVYALLLAFAVGPADDATINTTRIADLCSQDWGLYRTFQLNLERLQVRIDDYDLTPEDRSTIASRLDAILQVIESAPKTTKWKLRARVGDRKQWYQEPEEVEGAQALD